LGVGLERGVFLPNEEVAVPKVDSIGLVTALSPRLGYETATRVAQEALLTGAGVEIVLACGFLIAEELDELVSVGVLSTCGGTP
jgi:aspartate ammonia-lyase